MNKLRFLVTAVNGDIGTAVVKILKDEFPSCYIVGCDIVEYPQSINYIDAFLKVPAYNAPQYLQVVSNICKEYDLHGIIPTFEDEIKFIGKNREVFKNIKVTPFVANDFILNCFESKDSTSDFLTSIHVNVPKTFEDIKTVTNADLPVILKPNMGRGSKGIVIINTAEELEANTHKRWSNYVVQSYVGTMENEYTIPIYSDGKEVRYICYKRKLGLGGASVYVETADFEWLEPLCKKIADTTNLIGCINLQMRVDNGTYYVFEINPRISSTVRFRYLMGYKDLIWWIQAEFYGEISNYKKCKNGLVGVKTVSELIFTTEMIERLQKGNLNNE